MMGRGLVSLLVLVALAACGDSHQSTLFPVDGSTFDCVEPAPLLGEPEMGLEDDYFVCFKDGVDVAEEAARLAEAYGFTPRYVYSIIPCLAVRDLPQEIVDSLRCEPTVDHLSYDGKVEAA